MDESSEEIPQHIAIIMDGNGRWARKRGLPRTRGHKEGIKSVQIIVKECIKLGVKYLTLYAFSTENWNRPKREVNFLMRQLELFLKRERPGMVENSVRLLPIGRIYELPPKVVQELEKTVEATAQCDKLTLCLALNYGGRLEIVDACRKIAEEVKSGKLKPEQITEEVFSGSLYTSDIPDPDLLIRTAGEQRVSNFLLWQLSYAELYISKVSWPDFRKEHLRHAIAAYVRRERRFGRVR